MLARKAPAHHDEATDFLTKVTRKGKVREIVLDLKRRRRPFGPLRVLKFLVLILNNHLYTRQSQNAPCSIPELATRNHVQCINPKHTELRCFSCSAACCVGVLEPTL